MPKYNKLVRDKIPEICLADGVTPHYRIIEGEELTKALGKKLVEEAKEVEANPSLGELADVSEVLISLGEKLGFSPEQIETARLQKAEDRGRFSKGIFLESTDE